MKNDPQIFDREKSQRSLDFWPLLSWVICPNWYRDFWHMLRIVQRHLFLGLFTRGQNDYCITSTSRPSEARPQPRPEAETWPVAETAPDDAQSTPDSQTAPTTPDDHPRHRQPTSSRDAKKKTVQPHRLLNYLALKCCSHYTARCIQTHPSSVIDRFIFAHEATHFVWVVVYSAFQLLVCEGFQMPYHVCVNRLLFLA